MLKKLYKKENNIFQSAEWLSFQESYGRPIIALGEYSGVKLEIPFGKNFIWIQKGPSHITNTKYQLPNNEKGTVFIRIEPGEITAEAIKLNNLIPVNHGSLLSGQTSPKATQVLDISKSEEELLADMKPKTRYNIRLAEKKGVKVKRVNDAGILFELLKKTASRDKGYAPHQKDYYLKMMEALSGDELVQIFVAEHEGDFLSAIMVSFYGECATYLHGGFNDEKRNLMAPYLCQWEAIKYAKSKSCTLYDFWGVAETDNESDPWAGITRFKEGFGGEKVIFPGAYDLPINKFWYTILRLAAKAKHLIR